MHRITTTMTLTPEELEYLVHYLRPKNDADWATKTIIRNINNAATGEFRMAQLHGRRKGFLVHIIRHPDLQAHLKPHDFVCLPSVSLMVAALERFLETGQFEAEVIRA